MATDSYEVGLQELRNAIKTLYANIRFASIDQPVHTLVITSSIPNEGKSSVAIELCRAIAESGKRVCLVECDMRNRSLAGVLGVHPRHGMYSVMSGETRLEDALSPTGTKRMDFLDVEPHIPNPIDVLSSARFSKLMASLKDRYDYVILDTPPVGTFVDAAILSSMVDATALVVRLNFTKKDEVLRSYEQLEKAHANLIGAIATFTEMGRSSHYYYYYENNDNTPLTTDDAAPLTGAPKQSAAPKAMPKKRSASSHESGAAEKGDRTALPRRRSAASAQPAPQEGQQEQIGVISSGANPYLSQDKKGWRTRG